MPPPPAVAVEISIASARTRERDAETFACSKVRPTPWSSGWSSTPPSDLDEALTLLDLPLPDGADLRSLISSIASSSGIGLSADVLDTLTSACSGLSAMRVRQVAARALAKRGQLGAEDLRDVLEEKRQTIARSEVLEFCATDTGTEAIGGLEALKTWLDQRHRAFSEEARRFGLPVPGVCCWLVRRKQATDAKRSHAAGRCHATTGCGRPFAGLVGAARPELVKPFNAGPCILWIDEMTSASAVMAAAMSTSRRAGEQLTR